MKKGELKKLIREEIQNSHPTVGDLIKYLQKYDENEKLYLTDGNWIGPTPSNKISKLIFKSGPQQNIYVKSSIGK